MKALVGRPDTPARPRPVEPKNGILFAISNHGGQSQFWHSWCEGNQYGSPMVLTSTEGILRKFKCVKCNRVGQVELTSFPTGNGTLFDITQK